MLESPQTKHGSLTRVHLVFVVGVVLQSAFVVAFSLRLHGWSFVAVGFAVAALCAAVYLASVLRRQGDQ